ncbi:aldolase [Bacillus paranthracis]|uniref:aldolase n=1 Tax=Bacillus TaxID=1386 RepID=UPI0009B5260F|nr:MULTISPECIES: aldolase [Bacillus cereus group]MBL3822350.1 aldolase [Bacillus cereus]MBL3844721.1 aldolase [Bacillus cereus]MDA1588045.1 aldolase [Bacillus cereus group sp. TH225LC]MDA1888962.1 aldolase [Bacillus cereus group sp. BY11-1LC]MDA2588973.1 aldolase [Bacillus cereus group sp. Bc065]
MIKTTKTNMYKVFGLRVLSEIQLPELPRINEQEETREVIIRTADLFQKWSEFTNTEQNFVVDKNVVMIRIPDTAIFSIQEGKQIIVSPMGNTCEDKIRLYILGICMGALLMQRGILPLHGSAINIDGKVYAILGNSGAGKSTLAAAFLSKGYTLLSDDVIAVTVSADKTPIVIPSYPQQKLWAESLNAFGMGTASYNPLFERETKYAVPVQSHFFSEPLPLAGVIELTKTEDENVELIRMEGLERLRTLFFHTFRKFLVTQLKLTEWHFTTSTSVINKVDMFHLKRPNNRFTAHELVSIILKTIHGGVIDDVYRENFSKVSDCPK